MLFAFRSFALLFFLTLSFSLSAKNIDSLESIINKAPPDSMVVKAYFELAGFYYYDNPDTAIFYYKEGIERSKSLDLHRLTFYAQVNIFSLFIDRMDYFNAKIVAVDAVSISETIKDSLLISKAYSNMGSLYMFLEMNEKALSHFRKAIKIYPIENNPIEAGKLFGRIGNLYLDMGYLDDAEKSYIKAKSYFEKANVKRGIILVKQNLGIIEKQRGNYDSAIVLYNQAKKEHESIDNQIGVAQCIANIGYIYIEKKEYTKALTNIQSALKIFINQNQKIDEISCYSQIAEIYMKIKKPDLAINYVNKSYQLIQTLPENVRTRLAILYRLQEVYASAGDSATAYRFLKEYQILNDTLFNQDSQRRVDLLKTQFEFEQKEKDIQLLIVENDLKETELHRKKIFQFFYWILIGLAIFAISVLVFLFRIKKKANIALELKNSEILQQKEEIQAQRDEIEAQRDMVYSQKQDLEFIHLQISQSIEYAQLIQASILPDPMVLSEKVSDHFVYYKPKDIVSGDFYWWAIVENNIIIAAVDCTGHGVPGAFMSMLGISFLREIVINEYITHPGVILRKLRKEIIKSLKQKYELGVPRDGMDMALISINQKTNEIQFSGANNPIYIISNNLPKLGNAVVKVHSIEGLSLKLFEIKPDKMPIAIYYKMEPFTNHEIPLQKGDQIYMFSDGFVDQFGGKDNKRFMYSAFRELLLKNAHKPMNIQKEIIESSFEHWRDGQEQIDDVVVLGIKI